MKIFELNHDFKHFNVSMMSECNENLSLVTMCLIFENTRSDSKLILKMTNTFIINLMRLKKRSRCNFHQVNILFDSLYRDSLKYCCNSSIDFVMNNDFFIQRLNAESFAIIFSNVIDIENFIRFE